MIVEHNDRSIWRNLRPVEPLPEPHPDRWQWRPGEIALGPEPRLLPTGWRPLLADLERRADGAAAAANG